MMNVRIMAVMLVCALACVGALAGCGSSGAAGSASGSADAGASASASASSSASASADDPFARPIENETDALNRVHDLLMRAGKTVPPKIEFDSMTDDGRYLIHGYEIVKDGPDSTHEATWFYYSVGADGSIYDEALLVDIDPLTMEPME